MGFFPFVCLFLFFIFGCCCVVFWLLCCSFFVCLFVCLFFVGLNNNNTVIKTTDHAFTVDNAFSINRNYVLLSAALISQL